MLQQERLQLHAFAAQKVSKTMSKYDDLLERAKWDKLTDEEVKSVAEKLQNAPDTDRYSLLHILGRAGNASYRAVVEPFLEGPDELEARLAVWILCRWWGLTDLYIDTLLKFMRGVTWDERLDGKIAAIGVVGEYLNHHSNWKLLHKLIQIFENRKEEQDTRRYAYYALAESLGYDTQQFPPIYEDVDLLTIVDPVVILKAKARLAKER